MFDQLMQMIQQQGQQAVVENKEVPDEHNEAVMNEAQHSITSGLQGLAATGDLNQLMESSPHPEALAGNPAVQNISDNFMGNIMAKFGISKEAAAGIAGSLIPSILGKVMGGNKQGAGGGFDLGGLLSSLTGGAAAQQPGQAQQPSSDGGGIMGKLSHLGAKLGLDKDGDGDVDMDDLSKLIK
jgi:hypothetical protein